jgi:ARC6-like, IMS domain
LNQSQAIESIQRFLEAKPSIFAPPFDADLAKSVTTGPLYSDITKKDGSIAWLKARQASYRFSDYKIDRIWGFSNSTPRPSLKLQITENKILYGPKGIIESESGQTQQNMTYFLEFEDNRWKIYDRRVDDNQNEDSLRTKGP